MKSGLLKYFNEPEIGQTRESALYLTNINLKKKCEWEKRRIGETDTDSPLHPFAHPIAIGSPFLFKYFANSNSINIVRRFNIFFRKLNPFKYIRKKGIKV